MKWPIKFFADPAIGFPWFGWAVRFKRSRIRGFGAWGDGGGLYVAFWKSWRIDTVRIPMTNWTERDVEEVQKRGDAICRGLIIATVFLCVGMVFWAWTYQTMCRFLGV